jgi:hypothetical protein
MRFCDEHNLPRRVYLNSSHLHSTALCTANGSGKIGLTKSGGRTWHLTPLFRKHASAKWRRKAGSAAAFMMWDMLAGTPIGIVLLS